LTRNTHDRGRFVEKSGSKMSHQCGWPVERKFSARRAQLALAGACGTLNGAARMTFVTAPLRKHWVQTLIALFEPVGVVTRTCCRFGRNLRRLIPVIFVPTPPKYFFLPRVVT
jgi:hypothetical protein